MYDNNDRYRLGLPATPAQTWPQITDYSPDRQPSHSRIAFEHAADGARIVMLAVRGLGVVCIVTEGHPITGRMQMRGTRTFTREEIGYAPGVI